MKRNAILENISGRYLLIYHASNSSPVDELGRWYLQSWWSPDNALARGGAIHGNPGSSLHQAPSH